MTRVIVSASYDSDNTASPPDVEVRFLPSGEVILQLSSPARAIQIDREDWLSLLRSTPPDPEPR